MFLPRHVRVPAPNCEDTQNNIRTIDTVRADLLQMRKHDPVLVHFLTAIAPVGISTHQDRMCLRQNAPPRHCCLLRSVPYVQHSEFWKGVKHAGETYTFGEESAFDYLSAWWNCPGQLFSHCGMYT